MLSAKGQTARFAFPKLPAGRHVLMNLTRYQSALEPLGGHFKWEYPCDPYSCYPYQLPGYFDLPPDAWAEYSTPEAFPGGIELAGVLVVPAPSRDFMRDLRKVLCGYNCEPWTCRATD